MEYEMRAQEWFNRALTEEKYDFVKFILFFISFEVYAKLKNYSTIRKIKRDDVVKEYFFSTVDKDRLLLLKQKLDNKPIENMKPNGDHSWGGIFKSEEDFDGIVEFIIRARNNLFHGDKGLDDERDKFIVRQGNFVLQYLVKALKNDEIQQI